MNLPITIDLKWMGVTPSFAKLTKNADSFEVSVDQTKITTDNAGNYYLSAQFGNL